MTDETIPTDDQTPPAEDAAPETDNPTETTEPDTEVDTNDDEQDDQQEEPRGPGRFRRALTWYGVHKKKTVPATLALLLIVVFGLPASRYALLGLVLKKTYVVAVTDAKSHLPVSEVSLNYHGQTVKTGSDGKATFRGVPVGIAMLKATKK